MAAQFRKVLDKTAIKIYEIWRVDNFHPKFSRNLFVLILGMIVWQSCGQKYFHLKKLSVPLKRGIVALDVKSLNPEILNKSFEIEVKDYAAKRLRHEGYKCQEKNAQYFLQVEMKVDSSINSGIAYGGPGIGSYSYLKKSRAILIYMELRSKSTDRVIWTGDFDLYFFEDPKRDLKRTKGVVKYLISTINEK